jgi:nuclear pore complex protein Nup188
MAISIVDAGPSSSSGNTEGPSHTLRQLYFALESPNNDIPLKTLQASIERAIPSLSQAYQPPKQSSSSSASKLDSDSAVNASGKAVRLDKSLLAIAKECAALHDIDEIEVALSLRLYLDSDEATLDRIAAADSSQSSGLARSTKRRGKAPARASRNDTVTNDLLDALSIFYFDERLYALKCVSALLRIGDDRHHLLNEVAESSLRRIIGPDHALKCLQRVRALCQEPLRERLREVPRYSTYWARYNLHMQLALLEVVFMTYYSRQESTASFVDAIHQLAYATNFATNQVNSGFFDNDATILLDCIAKSVLLLCIESLDVEKIIDGTNIYASRSSTKRDDQSPQQLIESPEVVGKAITFLKTSSARDTLRGPLLLIWALFLCRFDSAVSDWNEARHGESLPAHLQSLQDVLDGYGGAERLWTDFVSAAFMPELDLFTTLNSVAKSALVSWTAASAMAVAFPLSYSLALRAVLKGLLISITEMVRPEYLQDFDGLVDLWQHTFAHEEAGLVKVADAGSDSAASLCAQFWQVDFEHERRRSALITATRRFPVNFRHLTRLSQALSGSGPGSLNASNEAWQASRSVLDYLASVDTIAMIMPLAPAISAPFEPHTGDSTHAYKATRAIPVFGRHLMIPKGTLGDIVSAEGQKPIVMIWHLGQQSNGIEDDAEESRSSYSAWRLMRDVLACFAGLLDRKDAFDGLAFRKNYNENDAAVFANEVGPASFATLSPGDSSSFDGDIAAEILDLFSSVLATDSSLAAVLVAHLNGHEPASIKQAVQPTSQKNGDLDLGIITLTLLNQALGTPDIASQVITSAYRFLTLWSSQPGAVAIWTSMRSSGILTGTYGSSPISVLPSLSRASNQRSLLVHEVSIGRYAGVLAMLNFHHALLMDFQQTSLSLSPTDEELKMDVLLRVIRFVAEEVWLTYQDWKFVQIRQKIDIGLKCIAIFSDILRDRTMAAQAHPLITAVQELFLYRPASNSFGLPLLRILASGEQLLHRLQRAGRQLEIEQAKDLLEKAFTLARLVVRASRRKENAANSIVESAFIESGVVIGSNTSAGLANATLSCILSNVLTSEAKLEASRLFTDVCSSLSASHQGSVQPAIISHLGSISDVEESLAALIANSQNEDEGSELRTQLINLLTAFVDGQPALATLLLTGRHIAFTQQDADADKVIGVTALEAMCELVSKPENVELKMADPSSLAILEAALKFLASSWKYAGEHRKEFDPIRSNKSFWQSVFDIAAHGTRAGGCSTMPVNLRVLPSGVCATEADEMVMAACLQRTCATGALLLLAEDVRLAGVLNTSQNKPIEAISLQGIIAWFKDAADLKDISNSAVRVQCDPLRHLDVLARMEETFPELRLDDIRLPTRIDQFDTEKQYGCSYVYDIKNLRFKLRGLARNVNMLDAEGTDVDEDAILQASLLLAGINLEWSMIDAQSMCLRAWTGLMSAAIGPLFDHLAEDEALRQAVQTSAGSAWVACAVATADEEFATSIVKDIHALRISFLATLLEMAASQALRVRKNQKWRLSDKEKVLALEIMHQAVRLVSHPLHSIEDSMRQAPLDASNPLHRDASRILMTCSHFYRACRTALRNDEGNEGELLRSLTRYADTIFSYTVTCMRIALDRCLLLLNFPRSFSREDEAVRDGATYELNLVATSLSLLLHADSGLSAQNWLPRMLTSELLPCALEVFRRSPIPTLPGTQQMLEQSDATGTAPSFWNVLLEFFLTLAGQASTAETFILAGAMDALSNNALTQYLERLQEGGHDANQLHDKQLHKHWLSILRVAKSLTIVLDASERHSFVVAEMLGFCRVYAPLLQSALDKALLNAMMPAGGMLSTNKHAHGTAPSSSSFKSPVTELTSLKPLQELEMITGLYKYLLAAYPDHSQTTESGPSSRQGAIAKAFIEDLSRRYVRSSTYRLQEAVHLLQHPHELAIQLRLDEGGKSAKKDLANRTEAAAKRYLLQISANIIGTFWTITCGARIFCSSTVESNAIWSLENVVVVPTISTSPTQSSTIGTLLDLASYICDSLRSSASDLHEKQALHSGLEQTLSLASAQLTLSLHGVQEQKGASSGQRRSMALAAGIQTIDVEAGLGRDVTQATESAKATVREYLSQRAEHETETDMRYLDLLTSFQKRWLISQE